MADQKNSSKRSSKGRSNNKGRSTKRAQVKGAIDLVAGLASISRSRFNMDKPNAPIAKAPDEDQDSE